MTTEFLDIEFSGTPIVKALDITHDSITIKWSAPIMARPITAYQIMVRKSYPNGPQIPIDTFATNSCFSPRPYEIISLASKALYFIQVRGLDSDGYTSNWSKQQGYKTL